MAALREQGDASTIPLHSHRRSMGSKRNTESLSMSSRPSMHSYFNGAATSPSPQDNEALEDNSYDEDAPSSKSISTKARNRRASEGSYLIKGEGKKSSSDLRCDTCGKGYKHSSCLTKHLYGNIDWVWSFLVLMLSDGNTTLRGPSPRNSSSPSTNKSNSWRPHRSCAT